MVLMFLGWSRGAFQEEISSSRAGEVDTEKEAEIEKEIETETEIIIEVTEIE